MNRRLMITICSVAFAFLSAAVAESTERYIVVMKAAKAGTAELSDDEVTRLGGAVVLRTDGRMVVTLPPAALDALRNHPRVKYVQRSVTGAAAEDDAAAGGPIVRLHAGTTARAVAATVAPPVWQSGTYRYDGAGNIYAIGADPSDADRHLYTYDALSRLEREATLNSAGGTLAVQESFAYDLYGNITSHTEGQTTTPYAVVASTNRFQTGPGMPPYQYNEIGALTADAQMTYDYDAFGMLRWRALRGEPSPSNDFYLYTAGDERIAVKEHVDTWTWSLRDFGGKVLRQYQSSSTNPTADWLWVEDYVYRGGALATGERVREEGGRREFHLDHLGSPRLVTGADGFAMSTREFAPFGIQRGDWAQESEGGFSREEPLRFTGHERDFGLGDAVLGRPYLDYMHARYYSPGLGRFLSVDPSFDDDTAENPQKWNRYAYVLNNPLRLVDADGRSALDTVNGYFNALLSDYGLTVRIDGGNADYKVGQLNGDRAAVVTGFILATGGTVGTIVGAPTVVVSVASAAVAVVGAVGAVNGAVHLAQDENPRSGGGRTSGKVSRDALQTGRQKVDQLRQELKELQSKPNKTPADKQTIEKKQRELNKAIDQLRKSEEHARTQQHS